MHLPLQRRQGIHPFQHAALQFYSALAEEAQARPQHPFNPSRLPRLQRAKSGFEDGLSLLQGANLINLRTGQRNAPRVAASAASLTARSADENDASDGSISSFPSRITDPMHPLDAADTDETACFNVPYPSLTSNRTTIIASPSTNTPSPVSTIFESP